MVNLYVQLKVFVFNKNIFMNKSRCNTSIHLFSLLEYKKKIQKHNIATVKGGHS